MNSYRLCLRAAIVGGLGIMVAATSACGSSSGGTPTAAPASVSSAPVTPDAAPTTEEAAPTESADTTSGSKPKSKGGNASNAAVCKKMEPSLNKIINGAIENDKPSERPKLNKILDEVASDAREQADRAKDVKLGAALRDMADAVTAMRKADNLATAEKEGEDFQNAVQKVAPFCEA